MGMESGTQKRLTLPDWLLLGGAFLALLIGIPLWLYGGSGGSPVEIRYTVCISGLESTRPEEIEEIEKLIPAGASVGAGKGEALLGIVEAVERRPHVLPAVRKGAVEFVVDPYRWDVYVSVLGNGQERWGDGVRVGDIRISAGEKGSFRFGGLYVPEGLILTLEIVEK